MPLLQMVLWHRGKMPLLQMVLWHRGKMPLPQMVLGFAVAQPNLRAISFSGLPVFPSSPVFLSRFTFHVSRRICRPGGAKNGIGAGCPSYSEMSGFGQVGVDKWTRP